MNKKKGLTLVELLGVIVVIAIIVMIATPNVFMLINKGDRKAFQTSITQLVTATDKYNEITKYYYYLNGELKNSSSDSNYKFTDLDSNQTYKIKIEIEN